jgi:hypothetical protein
LVEDFGKGRVTRLGRILEKGRRIYGSGAERERPREQAQARAAERDHRARIGTAGQLLVVGKRGATCKKTRLAAACRNGAARRETRPRTRRLEFALSGPR